MKYGMLLFICFNMISCVSLDKSNYSQNNNSVNNPSYRNEQGLNDYYETRRPYSTVIFLEDSYRENANTFIFPYAPKILRYYSKKPSDQSFLIAKECISDIGTSIIFSWKNEFNEINYKRTKNVEKLLELWIKIERDYLLKLYSNQIVREYYIWSKILGQPYEKYDDEYNSTLIQKAFNEIFSIFYPLLADPEVQKIIKEMPHTSQLANYHSSGIIYMPKIDTEKFVFEYMEDRR